MRLYKWGCTDPHLHHTLYRELTFILTPQSNVSDEVVQIQTYITVYRELTFILTKQGSVSDEVVQIHTYITQCIEN